MKKKPYDDEINISDLIFICGITKQINYNNNYISYFRTLYYNSLSQSFTSTTKIKPISTF